MRGSRLDCESLPGLPRVYVQSDTERWAVIFEWALRRPSSLVSQPEEIIFEVNGHIVHHFVDLLVVSDVEVRLEAKGAVALAKHAWLPEKLACIAKAYRQASLQYEVATAFTVRNRPLSKNVADVYRQRQGVVELAQLDCLMGFLAEGEASLGEINRQCFPVLSPHAQRRTVLWAHAHKLVTIDLLCGPISETTMVSGECRPQALPWWRLT